jgi:hypothetical protein
LKQLPVLINRLTRADSPAAQYWACLALDVELVKIITFAEGGIASTDSDELAK